LQQTQQQQPLPQLQQQQQVQQQQLPQPQGVPEERNLRQGKNLFDFVGLGTGSNTDPFLAKVNANCLTGDLAECFKSQALGTFSDFFNKPEYFLNENTRVVRGNDYELRSLEQEPYEFSTEARADESEWDQLVKFALRKVERFVKSAAIEVKIPNDVTEGGRYSPRFISDEIADEIDVLEDKTAPLYGRHKLKKLFIPLLIILKLFKLKLLLFLPLILGLASFKKFLGFLAIIVPGIIGYFRLCRSQSPFGGSNFFNGGGGGFQQYSPQGVGIASYQHQHTHIEQPYYDYYGKSQFIDTNNNNNNAQQGVRFGDSAQNVAYQGYSQYRSNNNVKK